MNNFQKDWLTILFVLIMIAAFFILITGRANAQMTYEVQFTFDGDIQYISEVTTVEGRVRTKITGGPNTRGSYAADYVLDMAEVDWWCLF